MKIKEDRGGGEEEEKRRGSHDSGTGIRVYVLELKKILKSVMDNLVGGSPLST